MRTITRLPQRITVVGTSGSGKTTLARRLSETLNIPHVEFDALYWGPNWNPPDKDFFRQQVSQKLAADRWVACGNYSSIREVTYARADTMVWLDYPFALVLARLIRRTARRLFAHERICGHNYESLLKVFSSDSIIIWAFKSHWKNRRRYLALADDSACTHLSIVRLRAPKETELFLQSLSLLVE